MQCPFRRIPNGRISIFKQRARGLRKRGITGIPDRIKHVAHKPVAPDPLDRRAGKFRAECRVVQLRKVRQPWRRQILARRIPHIAPRTREFVPGANRQTIVAAVYPVTKL